VIVFCSNSTGWDEATQALVPGGQVDAYIRPILEHLDAGSYVVERQPRPGAVNVYLSTRGRYKFTGGREIGRAGVQISHGIADKNYRRGAKVMSYTHVTSPGPTHTRRFRTQGVPAHKIVECGYPKLDPIFQGKIPAPERDGRIRVVWAPTHGGGSEEHTNGNPAAPGALATSWWDRGQVLDLLDDPERFDVVEAPHPRHRPDGKATLAEYVRADVVIADGGSTIYEAWALGIPVVFPTWLSGRRHLGANARDGGKTLECRIYADRLGFHADTPDQLPLLVEEASVAGLGDAEQAFIDKVLPPEVRGRGGELHAALFRELDR
jgi:hypothetical protein